MIELKGEGCREFENNTNKTIKDLFEYFIIKLNLIPTRLDIAIDDYDGTKISQQEVLKLINKEQYTSVFKTDPIIYDGKKGGFTIQFGRRGQTQMLCIYDKLKEQTSRKNQPPQKYWCRYEMRFYKLKAYQIAMNIMDISISEFKEFSFGLLYSLLDLKEESNYQASELYKAKTHPKWLAFVQNHDKAIITKYTLKEKGFNDYEDFCNPIVSFYIFNLIVKNANSLFQATTYLYEQTKSYLDKIDEKKLKKTNLYLKDEVGKKLTMQDVEDIKNILNKELISRSLPF